MKLELGCGVRPTPGYVHHDRTAHAAHIDVAHDLDALPWPWGDESAEAILALDVMEHLKIEVGQWLDECWRILVPGGALTIRVAAWDNPALFWRDATHRRAFHEETFYFWDPAHPLWQYHGCYYYTESARWWTVESVDRANADPRYGIGDLRFVLRKRAGEWRS